LTAHNYKKVSTDTVRALESCTAQASKTKLASKYPDIIKMDKKGKHALLCKSAYKITRFQEKRPPVKKHDCSPVQKAL
jgi:peptide subunit release factor RF-3